MPRGKANVMKWVLCCALLLVPAAVPAQQVVRQQPLTLQLDVDAQGQVSAAKVMGHLAADASRHHLVMRNEALPAGLLKAIREVAENWRFKAPQRDGHPVNGRTYASATMKILKMPNGSYRMDLEYRRNGPVITFMPASRYPRRARRLGREAAVVVEATVQADGTIGGARVVKVFTANAASGRLFAKAALDVVRQWKGVPMMLDGHAVATRMRTAIYYQLAGGSDVNKDYGEQVGALLGTKPGGHRSPVAPTPDTVVAIDSPFVKQPPG